MAVIWIVGELNVDMIVRGSDVTPVPGREKLVDQCELALGSSSAITAAVLAGLGHEVRLVSIVGDDLFGQFTLEELSKIGVDTAWVTVSRDVSTGVTVSLSDERDRAMLTYMGSIAAVTPQIVPEELFHAAPGSRAHLHFGSYYLQSGMHGQWEPVLRRARQAGLTTSFDVGWDVSNGWDNSEIFRLLRVADYFLPNEVELLHVTGAGSVEAAFSALPSARNHVAVKRGGDGSTLLRPDGTTFARRPFRVTPIDTTGAGDSFNAGLIHGLVCGMSESAMLDFANASGALATQRVGGAGVVPSEAEVMHFIEEQER